MGWPIPTLTSLPPTKSPSYLRWGFGLILFIVIGMLLTLLLYQGEDNVLFGLYAIFAPFMAWLAVLGSRLTFYSSALYTEKYWEEDNQELRESWQDWSKTQLPILAHYVISAEQHPLNALMDEETKIPIFPEKARPLFNATLSSKPYWFLDEVKDNLQHQYPDYRKTLTHIYLPSTLMDDEDLLDAIFLRWNLKPEFIVDYALFMTQLYETRNELEPSLILTCQYNDETYRKHSKFITAMLIGSESFVDKYNIKPRAWLGRLMVSQPKKLSADIQQLFAFNQLESEALHHIWVSGLDKQTHTTLVIECHNLGIDITQNRWLHALDLTFAKPSMLTKHIMPVLASLNATERQQAQLTISEFDNTLYLQLITATKLI